MEISWRKKGSRAYEGVYNGTQRWSCLCLVNYWIWLVAHIYEPATPQGRKFHYTMTPLPRVAT